MTEFFIKYWVEAVFGLVLGLLGCGYRKLDKRLREQGAVKLGVQALLRDRIVQSYNNYLEKGYCPIYARDNLDALYRQYGALGGNGTVSDLIDRIHDLPTERMG